MDNAKQHWKILQKLRNDLANKVLTFMVIGKKGEGVIVTTEDGNGFWLGEMKFGLDEPKTATEPTLLIVPGLIQMAQGNRHILLLNRQGDIYSMGKNNWGQLGLGTVDRETCFSPQLISIPNKFTSVRCGFGHSVALTEDGKVWAWGMNNFGQVGVPSLTESIPFPCQISEFNSHRVVAVECGGGHSLALTNQGEVYAWGMNYYGQLGDGSVRSTHTPTQIPTPSPVQSMAAGHCHTLLLTQTGEVYACGSNVYGQLGLPTTTNSRPNLSKVPGLSLISQIASHPATNLSIAMSSEQQCFVWGQLEDGTSISIPLKLSSFYLTVESPLSFYSSYRNTPHSVQFPARECRCETESKMKIELRPHSVSDQNLSAHNRLLDRMNKMFNNSDSNPDVRFQVGDHYILAHRSVLKISSAHFHRLFSSSSVDFNLPSSVISTLQSGPNRSQSTTNTSKPDLNSTPTTTHFSQVIISIPDHSYPAFYAYLRFLYLGILEVELEHLANLFSLSVAYYEYELQQVCLSRMRTTLAPATCCLYYPLTLQHLLPELSAFQKELLQFISDNSSKVMDSVAYQSMDAELCKKLSISVAKHSLLLESA